MTLDNAGCVCGLCEASGQNIHQTPGTFPRILQALDLNKLPPLLTEEQLRQQIGLCNRCENKIKLLEEATNIRENLKESFVSNLKRLSGSYNSQQGPPNSNSDSQILNTFQQYNEITPDQHSMKRKISSLSSNDISSARRKQLKTQITHTLPISLSSRDGGEAINSSDEENVHAVSQLSPVSPQSSNGSYTPPANSVKMNSNQVLSELTTGRNRRKQARPSKAAGDIVPAVPQSLPLITSGSRTPTPSSLDTKGSESKPSIKSEPLSSSLQRESSPKLNRSTPLSNNVAPAHNTIPFNNSLYQSMLTNRNMASVSTAQTNSALLFAQSIFNSAAANAASKSPLMAINNPMMFRNPSSASLPFNKQLLPITSNSFLNSTTPMLMSVKKESSLPVFNYGIATSEASTVLKTSSASSGTAATMLTAKAISAETHTLVKTEKRRYCKVCAASSRKANNGRPPQSRFLCLICNMPMCRSCIEEHRFRILLKSEEQSEKSASEKLLQAVKMKDKATTSNKSSSLNNTKTTGVSNPPSNSSLIYGSHSTDNKQDGSQIYAAMIPNMPLLTTSPLGLPNLAMKENTSSRIDTSQGQGNFKPIAPAPPKLTNMSKEIKEKEKNPNDCKDNTDSQKEECINHLKSDANEDEDEDDNKLIISECDFNESTSDSATNNANDQTEITPQIANETAAMLDQNIFDESEDALDSSHDTNAFQSTNSNTESLPVDELNQSEKESTQMISEKSSTISLPHALVV